MPIERWTFISRNGEAGWCGRRKHQVVSHRGSLYLMGGYTSAGVIGSGNGPDGNLNDVWKSTEGAAWVRLLERAPWSGRDGHAALTHNGAIYLMGGTQDPRHNFSDVWRSINGRDWVQVCRQAPWQGRWQHAAVSYQGYMYVVGGWREGPGCLSDAWRSPDGVRWTKMCSNAPWEGRMFHSVVEANGAMYLLGGSNGRQKLNDSWVSTDGREWNLVTYDCQWCPRSGHASFCFENSMYVVAGEGNDGQLKDVWRSQDGAHWMRSEADVRVARQGHAALCHHGKALVLGGVSEGTSFMNDCLAGLTSAQLAELAGRARGRATPSPLPLPPSGHRGRSSTLARERTVPASVPTSTTFEAAAAASAAASAAAAAAGVSAGLNVVGGGPLQRSGASISSIASGGRFGSRQFSRHQSVEDDLWGWFGDDRPASETSGSLARISSSRGEGFPEAAGGGGRGEGEFGWRGMGGGSAEAEVTVSTLALTERLAKLSAGRALVDQVRKDNRSLVMLVSGAVRALFSLVPGSSEDTSRSAAAPTEDNRTSGLGASAGPTTTRAVQFAPDAFPQAQSQALAQEEEARKQQVLLTVAERGSTTAGDAGVLQETTEAVAKGVGDEDTGKCTANGTTMATSATELVAAAGVTDRAEGIRRTVVKARGEIEALQAEIKRLVREAGGNEERLPAARSGVSRLVARRAAVAAATLGDARRMAQRLEEISEAQQSNRSNIDAAMREVERRARLAGGRVWALIRGRSQLRNDDQSISVDEDSAVDGVSSAHASGGFNGSREVESLTTMTGITNGDVGVGVAARARTWDWALASVRDRGSFFDGDEFRAALPGGAVGARAAAAAVAAAAAAEAAAAVTGDGLNGESLTPDTAAKSFGDLERAVLQAADDKDQDRRETDESIAILRGAMEQHSGALARLAVWMVRAPPQPKSQPPPLSAGNNTATGAVRMADPSAWGTSATETWQLAAAKAGDGGSGAQPSNGGLRGALPPLTRSVSSAVGSSLSGVGEVEEEDGVLAMLELARELDVLEGKVRRERYQAHRAADEEIYRTPGLYQEACTLGNALILRGHDYLSQALADAGRDLSEAAIMAEEANAWTSKVAELVDADGLAAKGEDLKRRIAEARNSVLDQEDTAIDCRSALDKKRRRGASAAELEQLQADLLAAERGARRARRSARKAAAAAACLAHGTSPEVALDIPESLFPFIGRKQVVQDVSVANINLPVRRLTEYENLRPMVDEGSTGGGQGRHRIFLAEYDDETVVLKGYALVNALQRHSLARELHILDRIRHGAIIHAGAIVEDDGSADSPIPMLYIEFPYCSRGNLWQWLKSERRQPWELQAAFRQVMCAVMHLHDRGVIHKDIKPGNVLVHADGRFLLADFDVSKDTVMRTPDGTSRGGGSDGDGLSASPGIGTGEIERMQTEADTTRTSMAGTQGFMAPEVEAGRPSSLASDMYSVGALLFHMHFPDHPTGPLPLGEGTSGVDLSVLSLPRDTDAATVSLLKALLAAEPDKRPNAADALQADYFRVSHVSRLQEDGALLEQARKLEAVRSLFRNIRDEAKSAGPLKWTVKRDSRYLVPTVLELIRTDAAGPALRQALRITFEGEAGVDEGGILSEMYTLLFEALMLPRFGMFQDCDATPIGIPTPGQKKKKDPTERAFAPRFRGAPLPPAATSGSTAGVGITARDSSRDENQVYLEPVGGDDGERGNGDDDGEGENGEEGQDEDDGGVGDGGFDSRQEASRLIVESAAGSGVSTGGGRGGAEGKAGAKFLPTARLGGYTDAQLGRYRAVGRAMVKCLFEGRRIGSRLAPSVFKFITGTDTTMRDLQDFDPQTFESLKWMLANTGARDWGFHFEDIGQPEKGPVTDGNKMEYVSDKARLVLVGSRKPALEALKEGFAKALQDLSSTAAPFMGLLSHADWRVLLCGQEHVSGPQVVAVLTWYGFPARSEVPKWLKSLLLSLPEDALRRFLIFVCGTPSLPAPSAGKVEITVRCQPRSAALPAAHTCFFQLDVPDYDKEAVLRHKLLQAVNNTSSFDVV